MSASDHGNGSRATVALVDAKVDGLHELIRAEFSATQRQLDELKNLPLAVQSVSDRVLYVEARLTELEKTNEARQGWRRVTLPGIVIGVIALTIAAANILVTLNAN